MTEFDAGLLLAAWLTGLAGGGGHCVGMCGGIVGALGIGIGRRNVTGDPAALPARSSRRFDWRGLLMVAAAHSGRVASYATAGAVAGLVGAMFFAELLGPDGRIALRAIAAVLIFVIGLQLILGRPLLTQIERFGARFWRLLAPHLRSLLPPRDPLRAFAVGALWGWLPCGLVYAQLSVAAAAGSAWTGAGVMVSFGIGTMIGLSTISVLLHSLGIARLSRRASGALLLLFSVWVVAPLL